MEFGGLEAAVLRKYESGRLIDEQDKPYLEKMANIGLVSYGFSFKYMRETAKTTSLGYASVYLGYIR
jgi:hypothetical protein